MQSDWLTAIGAITREPEFFRYGIGGEISTTILVSILDCFQEKVIKKFLKKSKKPYLGGHFRPVLPKFGQNEFPWKKSCQFLNIPIIYKPAKNKKTNDPFLKSIPRFRVNQISAHLKTLSSLLASHQKVAIT